MSKQKMILFFTLLFYSLNSSAQNVELWSTTTFGGSHNDGTIFTYDATINTFTKVHDFSGADGAQPSSSLLDASDNKLYGLTYAGGTNDKGVIFSIDLDNFTYTVLYNFISVTGSNPSASLMQASNGIFYGTAEFGGRNDSGIIFSFDPLTKTYTDIFDLNYKSGYYPDADIIEDSNGLLYGLNYNGGSQGLGVLYGINTSTNTFSVIYNFGSDTPNCGSSMGNLIEGKNETLLGTALGGTQGFGVIFSYDLKINKIKILNYLEPATGYIPYSTLCEAVNGLFYGTTTQGGEYGKGVLFSFDTSSKSYIDFHNFDDTDGAIPDQQTVMQATDGKLYGLATSGGNLSINGGQGGGVLYSYDPSTNTFTHLFNFNDSTGFQPWGNLIQVTTTGLNQLAANNNQLSIYPNPSSGIININASKSIDVLKLTNLLGQVIYEAQPKQTQFTFELKDEGMYFVTITSDNETITKKVIVVK